MFGTGQTLKALNVARIVAAIIATIAYDMGATCAAAGAIGFHVRVKLWFDLEKLAYTIIHQQAGRPVD